MTYNVYQVAWEERVRRVVAASTNHAADFYEGYALDGESPMVTPDMNASDNWYGWAKIAFEQIGQVYASGVTHGGRPLENVQIRIGGPRETDVASAPLGDLRRMRRALAAYISQRDMAQLFIKSIDAEDIRTSSTRPSKSFMASAPMPMRFGASQTRGASSDTHPKTTPKSAFSISFKRT